MESKWGNRKEGENRESVTNNPRRNGNDLGTVFLGNDENGGDQNPNPTLQETNDESLMNVESGGEEITTIEEISGLVGDECMELREEQAQMVRKTKKKKKRGNKF